MEPAPGNKKPLYNSRIIDTYLKLIRSRYSFVNVHQLLDHSGMKSYEVADQGHWFTQEQVDSFYEKLVQMTGNKQIAREAGRYAASPEALGVVRQYALALVGPGNAFKLISKISENFTKSSSYESKILSSNKIEITVTPRNGFKEKVFQCENRIGFFEAFVVMFKNRVPAVKHTECVFTGGEVCRYTVTWERPLWVSLKKYGIFSTLVLFLSGLVLSQLNLNFTTTIFIPLSVTFISLFHVIVQKLESKELQTSLDNLVSSSDTLLDQIKINYDNALLTNAIGQTLNKQTSTQSILANVIQILEKHLDYDRGIILLANSEKTKLKFRSGFGYTINQLRLLKKTEFRLDRPESRGAFIVSFRQQKPYLINDLNELEGTISLRSQALAKKLGTRSFICCPIVYENESLGILAVENLKSKRVLVQSDMSLLMGIAPVIGISIRNATLMDAKEKQFKSLLQVLAASIDARDSLTAGHSEKVTEYAMGICSELDLPNDHKEMIRVAALLHDYGKIGVPDSILKKDGKLSVYEYEIVKTHANRTRELLEQINFEGILSKVPEVAGAHHEKIDGSGYPKGLAGKEIPLGAKIIAVADFFEAITAKRHYRDPMPINTAFELLSEKADKHFDKKIVNSLISYYKKKYDDKNLQMVS